MQTNFTQDIKDTAFAAEAEDILRSCVHCGFCTATCPTYQLLGDELDGPRGRIYLIKQVLEGQQVTAKTQGHLDRCLTCRACETTCPSGVRYGRLLDIGRQQVEQKVGRTLLQAFQRKALLWILPHPKRFGLLLRIGQLFRPFLPGRLKDQVPAHQDSKQWPENRHTRHMVILDGCVQSAAAPQINLASAQVFDRIGIQLKPSPQIECCGAVSHHLADEKGSLEAAKKAVDLWHKALEDGAEAIVISASGCAAHIKEYQHLLSHDPDYAAKAIRVTEATRDLIEVLEQEDLQAFQSNANNSIAFHSPCTLQHGQKLPGRVESLLERLGYKLATVPDAHLCCGSAGTYSILQPDISRQLRHQKLQALQSEKPRLITSANIGCLLHLQGQDSPPVMHWIELLAGNGGLDHN